MAKDTNFKFGRRSPKDSLDITPEKDFGKWTLHGSRDWPRQTLPFKLQHRSVRTYCCTYDFSTFSFSLPWRRRSVRIYFRVI